MVHEGHEKNIFVGLDKLMTAGFGIENEGEFCVLCSFNLLVV